jgi:hypothetical protein
VRRLSVDAVLIVAAALILATFRWTTPSYDVLTGPFAVEAKAGDLAQARTLTLTTSKIRFARTLRFKSGSLTRERSTGGVFAIVEATLEARGTTATVSFAAWEGPSGLRYAQSERVEGAPGLFAGRRLQPGLAQRGIFVFEIPPDQAQGATLIVAQLMEPRLDSQLRIGLPTGADALDPADALDLDAVLR